jgi:hypothetical protein
VVELGGRHLHGPLDLMSIGKTLASEGIASEEAPPTFLHVEPTGALGNEHMLEARVLREPGAGLQAVVAAQVVCDKEDLAYRIVCFNIFEQLDIILGITRSRTARDLPAIADPQRSIDPYLVIPTTVLQRGFDAMAIG